MAGNLPQVGLEAVIAGLPGFDAGAKAIISAYDSIEAKARNVEKATGIMGNAFSSISSPLSSLSGQFVDLGQGVLKFGAIAGGAALVGVGALTAGVIALGSTALQEFGNYQRMTMSITNLVAREISQGQVVEQQVQTRISLTKKENEELANIPQRLKDEELSRNTLASQIQEQKQRIIELTASYGENGLNVNTAKDRLAEMENEYSKSGVEIDKLNQRMSELNAKNGELTTTLEKVRVGQMSMTDAMAKAGPRAQEILKWTQLLAIQSPFTQEGVNNAFQTALIYGFTSEKAQVLTQSMIDFASATGKSEGVMNDVAYALGQINARGKVTQHELRMLGTAGIGVNRILEDMGMSLDDVTRGNVDYNKFIEAVIKDMQVFKGAAKGAATSVGGITSTLADIKNIGLREFFAGTFNAILPYLANFASTLTDMIFQTSQVKELGDALGQRVGGALKEIGKFIAVIQAGGLAVFSKYLGVEGIPLWYQLQTLISNISGALSSLGSLITTNLSGPFSSFTSNIIPMITQGITLINQNFEAFKGALMGIGAVLAVGVFAAIAAGILSLLTPMNLIIAGAALLGAAWMGNWGNIQGITYSVWATIQPVLLQLWTWLQTNIPLAIQATTDFWTNTLQPAMIQVGAWITGTLIPILTNIWTWLQTNLPVAIQYLSDLWAGTLMPAIVTVSTWITGTLIPTLTNIWNWLSVNIPIAIATLSTFWTTTLLPAIMTVYNFISTSVIPLFASLILGYIDVTSTRLQVLSDTWTNYLLPALTAVWGYLNDLVIPLWLSFADLIEAVVLKELEVLVGYFQNILIPAVVLVGSWFGDLLVADVRGFVPG